MTSDKSSDNCYNVVVAIPAYRVADTIEKVISELPPFVQHIIVANDASPDELADRLSRIKDKRLIVLNHEENQGVGGAMKSIFREALKLGADVLVKLDGDGQMPCDKISELIAPITGGKADVVKGNRFRDFKALQKMPFIRRAGNIGLSFLVKMASGNWHIFDPTNGFLALSRNVLEEIDYSRLASRYFFESSLLIEFNVHNFVVLDFPMASKYAGETSSLTPLRALFEFPARLLYGFLRRIWLKYFIFDFNIISLLLSVGTPLFIFGVSFASYHWWYSLKYGIAATAGTVMIGSLSIILGFQLLLQALVLEIVPSPHHQPRPLDRSKENGKSTSLTRQVCD